MLSFVSNDQHSSSTCWASDISCLCPVLGVILGRETGSRQQQDQRTGFCFWAPTRVAVTVLDSKQHWPPLTAQPSWVPSHPSPSTGDGGRDGSASLSPSEAAQAQVFQAAPATPGGPSLHLLSPSAPGISTPLIPPDRTNQPVRAKTNLQHPVSRSIIQPVRMCQL